MTAVAPYEAFRARVAAIRAGLAAQARQKRALVLVRPIQPATVDAGAVLAVAHAGREQPPLDGQSAAASAEIGSALALSRGVDWPSSPPCLKASQVLSLKMLERDARTHRLLRTPAEPPADEPRPATRGDCVRAPRPCPWVSCRHNTYLDAFENGSLQLNFPKTELDELPTTCSLDVADRGGVVLDEVAKVMNLTRERVRQIEERALRKLAETLDPELAT